MAEAALRRARAGHPALDFRIAAIDGPLPLADNEFDVVWASEVIEHVSDTARWLSEVRRVLAVGGRLLITTPSHGRLRLALGGIERFSEPLGDHLHLYSRRSLSETLEGFGFDQVQVHAVGGPPMLKPDAGGARGALTSVVVPCGSARRTTEPFQGFYGTRPTDRP